MDHKDIFEQTKKDLKGFKALVARLKANKLTLEKDTLLSDEERNLLDRKIKSDEIKFEKIKAALEFLDDTDLKIITSILLASPLPEPRLCFHPDGIIHPPDEGNHRFETSRDLDPAKT